MRFDDFFREYYYKKKTIRHSQDLDVAPRSVDICHLITMITSLLGTIVGFVVKNLCSGENGSTNQLLIFFVVLLIGLSVFIAIICTNTSEQKILKAKEVSQKRIDLVKCLLANYNIDYNNLAALDALLDEIEINKAKYDYAQRMKIPTFAFSSIMAPLGVVASELNTRVFSLKEIHQEILVLSVICLGLFLLFFLICNAFLFLLNRKYEVHNELAEDIRQIKLFSSNRI